MSVISVAQFENNLIQQLAGLTDTEDVCVKFEDKWASKN